MEPKLIVLRITVPQTHVPRRLAKFTVRLDEMEPLNPPKKWDRGDSILVYAEPLERRSLDDFLVNMEEENKFVLAWYEQKKPDPRDPDKVYHNLVYIWAHEEDGKAHKRFAPVRPTIRAELGQFIADHTFTVRRFYDNPYLDKEGQPVEGCRRWEVSLNGCQSVVPWLPKEQLPYQGGMLTRV